MNLSYIQRCFRRILCFVTACMTACAGALAEKTVTATATEINPDCLENTASCARILGWNEKENTLTIELIIPETFAGDEITELEIGDSIYTGGAELPVRSVERSDGQDVITLNKDAAGPADGPLVLRADADGNYSSERNGGKVFNTLITLECPVKRSLLFLDCAGADPCGGGTLPRVRSAEEFLYLLRDREIDPRGDNVYVVFGSDGEPAVIYRSAASGRRDPFPGITAAD